MKKTKKKKNEMQDTSLMNKFELEKEMKQKVDMDIKIYQR